MESFEPVKDQVSDLATKDEAATRQLKREHDSLDDFEHLDHDTSPLIDIGKDMASKSVDPPRASAPFVIDTKHDGNKYTESFFGSSLSTEPSSKVLDKPISDLDDILGEIPNLAVAQAPKSIADPKSASLAFMEGERVAVRPDDLSGVQRALEAQVAESKGVKKSESVEEVFEDLAKAALKMPEVQDAIDPKEDLFREKDEERNAFGTEHDSYGQVAKPDPPTVTRSNSVKLLGDLEFEAKDADADAAAKPVEFFEEVKSAVLPEPQKSPQVDFLKEKIDDDTWNVVDDEPARERTPEPPTKALPPLPRDATPEPHEPFDTVNIKGMTPNQFVQQYEANKGDSEFESDTETTAPVSCPIVSLKSRAAHGQSEAVTAKTNETKEKEKTSARKDPIEEIAPKEIFREMGLDAWFNPERLNPKVEALIYWRDPKKSGIVFGAILGVLLSLAYFSLISVLAYLSLLVLTGTVAFRIYRTILQAVQKTADGHPFKDVLDIDLTLPAEKVHDVADVAVAHANAAVAELRRLFLVEDLVDSLKFGVLLWCLTYLGAWFNGMTLIIIGVVALFSLPKVYETNKTQIDQNLDIVRGKINDLTAKVKAAIPIGKKSEPTKEE